MKKHCIFMVINDSFAIGGAITLYSFLKNNPWYDEDIIIGYGKDAGWGLSEENIEMLQNLYYKIKLVDLEFKDFYDIFNNLIPIAQSGVGFEMTVYKFHAFRLSGYKKVIMFDADMLVLDDVRELFERDIEFGALLEVKNEDFLNDVFKKRTNEYFNVGITIIGEKYLNEDTIIRCDNILKNGEFFKNSKIPHYNGLYPEQDILNVLTENEDVTLIPRIYSADRFFCDENNVKTTKIIHYLTYLKPWKDYDYKGWTQDEWEKYYYDYIDWKNNYKLNLSGEIFRYPKKHEDKDKYVVFTCAKNENKYIIEWVNHYLNLNFDKIFICDNNDAGDYSISELLSEYIKNGTVEVFDMHEFKIFQSHAYKMFCESGNFKWCAFFDCDEFLELNAYSDIKKYLETKKEDCIAFNWLMFNSNGNLYYEDKPLKERFKMPYLPINNIENSFLKGIVRGGSFKYKESIFCEGHLPISNFVNISYNIGGYHVIETPPYFFQSSLPLRYKEGYIVHYYTKSFEEWINKTRRGWPDRNEQINSARYFKIDNSINKKREDYHSSLFLDENILSRLENVDLTDIDFFIYEKNNDLPYPFIIRTQYIMSNYENKVFIIVGELSDDEYIMLMECAFVTGNKLAIVPTESDVSLVFDKYREGTGLKYWYKNF